MSVYIYECAKLDDSKLAACIGWNSTQFSKNILQSAHVAMGYSTLLKTKNLFDLPSILWKKSGMIWSTCIQKNVPLD